jgi:predicted phosphodiesterase
MCEKRLVSVFAISLFLLFTAGVLLSTHSAHAQEFDLVAAKADQDARLSQLMQQQAVARARGDEMTASDAQKKIDTTRGEDLWSAKSGEPALNLSAAPDETGFHPFNFAVLADLHLSEPGGPQRLDKALDLISHRHDIAFVLVLGDIVWDKDPDELKTILAKAKIPVHLVYGNNDWKWISNGTYEKSFGPRDYTFSYANCTFIQIWDCLPKDHPENHKGDFNEAQWSWLEQQLRQSTEDESTHTFVSMHIPPKTPGAFNNLFFMFENTESRFFNLLEKYKTTAALFGHLHQAAAWSHDGIQCYVTPSCCWNFISRTQKVRSSFVRIVKVEQTKITDALLPVRLDGETFTWETLASFYNPTDHPN